MTGEDATIVTAYGRLDRAALARAQSNYDTTALLSAVDELDRILGRVRGQDGLRDNLLQLQRYRQVVQQLQPGEPVRAAFITAAGQLVEPDR